MPKRKEKPELILKFKREEDIRVWTVLGLDPSLSRTGFAVTSVISGATVSWSKIGSVKPSDSSLPIWMRGKCIANYLRSLVIPKQAAPSGGRGLLVVMEYPTPMNDFLVALNRMINMVFWNKQGLEHYDKISVLLINASTLRSKFELKKTGNNKDENITAAYKLISAKDFPGLDSDACDAVLLAKVGEYAAKILLGDQELVEDKFKILLSDYSDDTKGKGRNQRIVKKGLMHNGMYWWDHKAHTVEMAVKDASIPPKKRLDKVSFEV